MILPKSKVKSYGLETFAFKEPYANKDCNARYFKWGDRNVGILPANQPSITGLFDPLVVFRYKNSNESSDLGICVSSVKCSNEKISIDEKNDLRDNIGNFIREPPLSIREVNYSQGWSNFYSVYYGGNSDDSELTEDQKFLRSEMIQMWAGNDNEFINDNCIGPIKINGPWVKPEMMN